MTGKNSIPRIVGLVPMRHVSERVPGKNYRDFAGEPLYRHIIRTLLGCELIEAIVIDTDSPTIMEDCEATFPDVHLIERPEELRDGTIPMNDILLYDTGKVPADLYLQTHSTNPLLTTVTVTGAIRLFLDNFPDYDSLFSVTRLQTRLWDGEIRPINHDPDVLLRTQDLPPVYEENSCIYIFSGEVLRRKHNRIGDRPLMFEMEGEEALDIDEEVDFRIAEIVLKLRENRV